MAASHVLRRSGHLAAPLAMWVQPIGCPREAKWVWPISRPHMHDDAFSLIIGVHSLGWSYECMRTTTCLSLQPLSMSPQHMIMQHHDYKTMWPVITWQRDHVTMQPCDNGTKWIGPRGRSQLCIPLWPLQNGRFPSRCNSMFFLFYLVRITLQPNRKRVTQHSVSINHYTTITLHQAPIIKEFITSWLT